MEKYYYIETFKAYKQRRNTCYDWNEEEVTREVFINSLKHITKEEYEILISGKPIYKYNKFYIITDKYGKLYRKAISETDKYNDKGRKIEKIINEIKNGRITKENICDEVARMTKRIKSEQSLCTWNKIVDWFVNAEW